MNNWQKVRLKDVISILGDGLHGTPKYDESGEYFFINGNNLSDGQIKIKSDTKRVNVSEYLKHKKDLNDRTLLVSINGTIGNVATYKGEKCILGKSACYFNILPGVYKEYIYYILLHDNFQSYAKNWATGTTIKNVSLKQMREYEFLLPSFEKQQQIAKILSSLDDKIELNAQINHNLEEQAKAIFKSWFVDFEPFGGVAPDNWQKGKLKNILSLQKRPIKAGISKDLPYLPIDSIPMRTFAITDVRPNSEAQSSLLLFDKDDILIGAMRVYFHRVIIAPFDGITRTTCFVLKPNDPAYLSFALLTCDLDSSVDFAQKTSKGSTMPYAVWDGGMGEIDILIPPLSIAMEFNSIVLPMLRKIQDSYREVYSLQKLRDALLPKLMSGEIDVSEVEI